jgi:hypothetical protein
MCTISEFENRPLLKNRRQDKRGFTVHFPFAFQSPKVDMIESVRTGLQGEFDNSLKAERDKWQRAIAELKEQHQKQIQGLAAKGKIRDAAERQVPNFRSLEWNPRPKILMDTGSHAHWRYPKQVYCL